jgi:hypothetical protein
MVRAARAGSAAGPVREVVVQAAGAPEVLVEEAAAARAARRVYSV